MELLEEHRCFDGQQQRWRHHSPVLNCAMTFSIFLPPERETPPPVLYWLSGLTCNDENFTTKAGAQRIAAELGIALVMPDTSPRGDEAANDDGYDLGQGAGFYLNATEAPGRRTTECTITCVTNCPRLFVASLASANAAPSAATRWAATARSLWRSKIPAATPASPPSRRSSIPPSPVGQESVYRLSRRG